MNLSAQFKEHLLSQNDQPSQATIKNYIADINQFIKWYEKVYSSPFSPEQVTFHVIARFKEEQSKSLSQSSLNRHVSSLRKFFNFLRLEGFVSHSPLDVKAIKEEDPWRLKDFKNYLYVYNASHLTIKNYIIDVKQFLRWAEEVLANQQTFDSPQNDLFKSFTPNLIEEYKKRLLEHAKLSPISINRKLSSLRRYFAWAKEEGLIGEITSSNIKNPSLELPPQEEISAPFLYSKIPPIRLVQKVGKGVLAITDEIIVYPLSEILSKSEYALWLIKGKPVIKTQDGINISFKKDNDLPIRNVAKEFYAPTLISTTHFPFHKKAWHLLRHTRPKWYKVYHSYALANYFHFAVLVIFMSALGFGLYKNLSPNENLSPSFAAIPTSPPRILSFQGKLTNSSDNPVTAKTTLRMSIYNNKTATGAALLWQEVATVTPDRDGVFSTFLGEGTAIPQSVFAENSALWLGVTVGRTSELTPRQQLATVAFATNAETLQGLEPITNSIRTSNVVLALNSSGNLSIGGSAAPTFQATGGQFKFSGQSLMLVTNLSSNGNITLSPDGTGFVDVMKPIQNTSNNGVMSTTLGSVEIDDSLAVLATSSSFAAFTVNQTSTGDIINAQSGGTFKFRVDTSGNLISEGNLDINGTGTHDIAGTLNLSGGVLTSTGSLTITPSGGTTIFTGHIRVGGNTELNGQAYAWPGGQTAGYVLQTNGTGTLSWVNPASVGSFWDQGNGALFSNNSTVDLLIGGQATTSAKFAVLNINSGTPLASISAGTSNIATYLTGDGSLGTTNRQTLTLGNSSSHNTTGNILLNPNGIGSVGIGTTTPVGLLDVNGKVTGKALSIFNETGDQAILTASAGGTTRFIVANNGTASVTINDNNGFFVCKSATGTGLMSLGRCNGAAAQTDITESIISPGTEPGDIVEVDPNRPGQQGLSLTKRQAYGRKSSSPYSSGVLGVVSTWGIQFDTDRQPSPDDRPIALAGVMPIKVSLEGGPIKKGDPITSSSIPGVGMKATRVGQIVAKATEDFDGDSGSQGKILALLNVSWHDPDAYITNMGNVNLIEESPDDFEVSVDGRSVLRMGLFYEATVAHFKAGVVRTQKLVAQRINAETIDAITAQFGSITTETLAVATDSFTVAGKTLTTYIEEVVTRVLIEQNISKASITSPIAQFDEISPAGDKLAIKLKDNAGKSKLEVKNASGSAVATIDSQGNASLSGSLESEGINVRNYASISGTLRASRIIADQIEGFQATSSAPVINNYYSMPSSSASGSLTAQTATFTQGLMSFGPSSFFEVSVADRLFVGTQLSLADRSINVLGGNLELQPLKQGGISFVGGEVLIDTEGNLKVNGNSEFAKDVSIKGVLFANLISPIPGQDLVLKLNDSSESAQSSQFIVKDSTGSALLSLNNKGDLIASGEATFAKLNLNIFPTVHALSKTEVVATGSAGIASINPHQEELTIRTPLVTKNSLIYITPRTDLQNLSVFLLRQIPGKSFTVGITQPLDKAVPFNWILIN